MKQEEFEKLDHVYSIICRIRKKFYDEELDKSEAHFEFGRLYSYMNEWIESIEKVDDQEDHVQE
jgi:hypothetical protein